MNTLISTRGGGARLSPSQGVIQGLAPDGGLFLPERIPAGPDPASLAGLPYRDIARRIIGLYFDEFSGEDIAACVNAAYGASFDDPSVVPLRRCGAGYLMELWHGPTSAFKDLALTVLPRLMTLSRAALGDGRTSAILTATSGDTGKAALSGFADVPGTDLTVFYPAEGVSRVQRLQMQTAPGANVEAVAVEGNFDDCQRMVKEACGAPQVLAACRGVSLSSANSINIGRLVPQIAYYYSSYARLLESGAVRPGEKVSFAVPTGNFGDILAGYLASLMGLPVGKLICASNSNNVLTDFIRTGVYDAVRPFKTTISPSMDILVSSNLERLLYLIESDGSLVRALMDELKSEGRYAVPDEYRRAIAGAFYADWADEEACRREIRRMWFEEGILIDPHTAVAMCAARRWLREEGGRSACVVLSTASPYKFPGTVLSCLQDGAGDDEFSCMDALSALTGCPVPGPLSALRGLPIRFDRAIRRDEGLRFIADKMEQLSKAKE